MTLNLIENAFDSQSLPWNFIEKYIWAIKAFNFIEKCISWSVMAFDLIKKCFWLAATLRLNWKNANLDIT